MTDTTEAPATEAIVAPSVDDQVKLATMHRDNLKVAHAIRLDEHNMQNAKLQWLHRALFEPTSSLGGVAFKGDQQQALLNRYGKLVLRFTKPVGEDEAIWPAE